MQVWKSFIEAQDILTSQYSEPFKISFSHSTDEGNHHFFYKEDLLQNIEKQIKEVFEGIVESDIHLKDGYFLFQADSLPKVKKEKLDRLRAYCDANYFDFVPKPCLTGKVLLKKDPFSLLSSRSNIQINSRGECFVSLDQIDLLDKVLDTFPTLRRNENIAAITKISAGETLINQQFELLSKYLTDEVGLKEFKAEGITKTIILDDYNLNDQQLQWVTKNSLYEVSNNRIIVRPKEETYNTFLKSRKSRNIFFDEEESTETRGVILPKPFNKEFYFTYSKDLSSADIRYKILYHSQAFNIFLENGNFKVRHEQVLEIDNHKFLGYIKKVIPSHVYHVNLKSETLSFYFSNREELAAHLKDLDKIKDVLFRGFDENHRYKVKIEHQSALDLAEALLHDIPSIHTHILRGGTIMGFSSYFDSLDDISGLKPLIQNKLSQLDSNKFDSFFDTLDKGLLKYNIRYREDEHQKEILKKLNYLKGEDLFLTGDPKSPLGTLSKIKYPELIIKASEKTRSLTNGDLVIVSGSLKGEKDKIKRLNDTLDAIFRDHSSIVNPKLKKLLLDASQAETLQGDILDSGAYMEAIRFIKQELLTPEGKINDSQIEAITKSLLSNDLFIIQGPPGTGKSTAIAEIIWQHIRSHSELKKEGKFKILLTSETNLAVDNALDKLRSKYHTLIKPIRFGSENKLDKEGLRFSLENLQNWVELGVDEMPEEEDIIIRTNIIKDWMAQISKRAEQFITEDTSEIIKEWVQLVREADENLRKLFFNTYVEHVNVVGATCSSIGKYTSENPSSNWKKPSPTRFFREYCSVYHPDAVSSGRINHKIIHNKKICFDLVIQDEASKASPPELALPCVFGKKAIIIGDHKQLPPMVDSHEFKENLEYLRNQSRDKKIERKINELLKIIDENKKALEKSHFEKLFTSIPSNLKSTFNLQYRMHPAINETIEQFYEQEGGLKCGLVTPKDLGVEDTNLENFASRYHGIEVERLISKNTHVVWLNVDSPEFKKGTSRINYGEIKAVEYLINQISQSEGYLNFISFWNDHEIEEKQIGIITFYGAQAGELGNLKRKYPKIPLRISPVDRFQGMERNIIIVSTVRSNRIAEFPNQKPNTEKYGELGYPRQSSLGFAEFPNRLNVALSRAKRLLIIVGNAEHFSQKEIYKNVMKTIHGHPNGVYRNFSTLKKSE